MTRFGFLVLPCAFLLLAGCGSQTMTPDYAVNVMPSSDSKSYAATPPSCPPFTDESAAPFDNQPEPQFGCATARNFAIMTAQPQDMLEGRNAGNASGITADGALLRYNNNQTRGLIDLGTTPDTSAAVTTATTGASALSGETAPASPSATSGGK